MQADLVNRTRELQILTDALGASGCSCLLLSGATGVGKTRLAREAMATARSDGWSVLETMGSASLAATPLGAFGRLVPVQRARGDPSFDHFATVHDFFAHRASRGPVLLFVDNGHLMDAASVAVVQHLAVARVVFVLLAFEADAPQSDAFGALLKEDCTRHLAVPPLDADHVGEVTTSWSGGPVSEATAAMMATLVDGDLVLLRELIVAAVGSDGWSTEDGVGHWNGDLAVTPRLSAAIDGRLAGLSGGELDAIEILAHAGSVSQYLLDPVISQSVWRGRTIRRFLQANEDGRRREVSVAPPLIAEVLRRRANKVASALALRDVAEEVTRFGARRATDASRIAVWRLDAGLEADGSALSGAAVDALRAGELQRAERLARAAISADGGIVATVALAQALIGQRRAIEAEHCLEAAQFRTHEAARSVELILLRAYNLSANLARPEDATALLEASSAAISSAARDVDRDAIQSVTELMMGRPLDALHLAAPVLNHDASSVDARVQARAVASWVLPSTGRSQQALKVVAEGERELREYAAQSAPPGEIQFESLEWDALWFSGRLDEAEALAWAVYRRAVTARALHSKAVACFYLGLCSRARGRVRTALAQFNEASALAERHRPLMVRMVLIALSQAAVIAGETNLARDALDGARALPGMLTPFEAPRLELSHAWLDALAGSLTAARTHALTAADLSAAHGLLAIEALALHDVARFGDPSRVAMRLQLLGQRTEGELLSTWSAHVASASSRDARGLDDVTTRYERMGYILVAAEASVDAARVHRTNRRSAQFRASRDRAIRLAAACEGATTPALRVLSDDATYDVRMEVTAREKEVAHLASTGLTNREIATLLGVSTRTVDNLMHRAFEKLEVHSRAELTEVLQAETIRRRIGR